MHVHPRSVSHKVFEVWRSPDRFTKNPDMVQLPSGRLLLVYSDTDQHWAQETQVLTVLASDDEGLTWFKLAEPGRADLRAGDERLVTPRLSLLRDGRLVVLCDHDDYGHFHQTQPSGNWAWWSRDGGETWTGPQVTGIEGFEPDRMMDLPDGRLAVCSHMMLTESQCYADILSCSDDGGQTWYRHAIAAHDGYHRFCEGGLIVLDGDELALVVRENHSGGIPSYVVFSRDGGRSWTTPAPLPFAFHRPYGKLLRDGRVMVTGRHVNGGLGTYAWVGDLRAEAGTYALGGPRIEHDAKLEGDALLITNGPDLECRYTLLPPESSRSEVYFQAELRVEGPADQAVALLSLTHIGIGPRSTVLRIAPNWIAIGDRVDDHKPVDMTGYRRVAISHRGGLLQVAVDGQVLIQGRVHWDNSAGVQDFHGGDPMSRTQFGQAGEQGRSWWRSVGYRVHNRTLSDFAWFWRAADGQLPDHYQRTRLIQIHPNRPEPNKPWPDHGYSSWLELAGRDGRILFVDYTNLGDPQGKSHLVGCHIDPEDIA